MYKTRGPKYLTMEELSPQALNGYTWEPGYFVSTVVAIHNDQLIVGYL